MSKREPQFNLRLSAELKNMIDEAAKENNRSINSEIVYRLEQSFTSADSTLPNDNNQVVSIDRAELDLVAEQVEEVYRILKEIHSSRSR